MMIRVNVPKLTGAEVLYQLYCRLRSVQARIRLAVLSFESNYGRGLSGPVEKLPAGVCAGDIFCM